MLFPLQYSKSSSKLNVLVNKLHEYLAHSTVEDNKHNAALQDVDGTVFNCSANMQNLNLDNK